MDATIFAGLDPSTAFSYLYMKEMEAKAPLIQDTVTEKVSEVFEIEIDVVKSKSRLKKPATARMVAIYILAMKTPLTLKRIGEYFGRDYSTVIYNRETCSDLMYTDRQFRKKVEALEVALFPKV